jgi:hypothetical protein
MSHIRHVFGGAASAAKVAPALIILIDRPIFRQRFSDKTQSDIRR